MADDFGCGLFLGALMGALVAGMGVHSATSDSWKAALVDNPQSIAQITSAEILKREARRLEALCRGVKK